MKRLLSTNLNIMLLSIVLILASCKAQKMTSEQLLNQEYVITQIGDKDVSDSGLTLNVNPENSTISGFAGCNKYNYSYELKDGELDMGFASATKMYCDNNMDLENLFFQKSASVTQFENSPKEINLKNKDGEVVIKAIKKEDSE